LSSVQHSTVQWSCNTTA